MAKLKFYLFSSVVVLSVSDTTLKFMRVSYKKRITVRVDTTSSEGVHLCAGYESAGVSYVNGERTASGNNANPYANANAPPAPADPAGGYHRTSGSNLGYPPYPSNTGSSGSSGYPSYPQSTNQAGHHRDLGYPPYPTQNRMPMPGQQPYPGYPQAPAGYPAAPANYPQQYPGYQNQPGYQNYPNQHQNQQRGYGYNTNSGYRRNSAATNAFTSTILVGLTGLLLLLETTL